MKAHGRFPKHGREDQRGSDAIGHGSEAVGGASTPDHPDAGVKNREEDDGEPGKGARLGQGAQQEGSGESQDGFAESGKDPGRRFVAAESASVHGGRSLTKIQRIMKGRIISMIAVRRPSLVANPILYVVYPR